MSAKTTASTAPSPSPLRRAPLRALARAAYATWSLGLFVVLIALAALLAFVVPRLEWRRAVTRAIARAWLALAGLPVRLDGARSLPAGPCVLVANHASYLDGIVMQAALPTRFSFVIKREAASMPVVGLLLRRLGAQFVDRDSPSGRQRDARRVVALAEAGRSLVFFPEGTFDARVGLKPFRIGAFVAAARGGVPVVPAIIHGARRALPAGALVPRPRRLRVEVLPPVEAGGRSPRDLCEASRAGILARLGEPDLAAEDPPA